jgi:hypothetical protein
MPPRRAVQTVSVPVQSLADARKRLRVQMHYKDTDMEGRPVTHAPTVKVGSSTISVGDASEAAMRSAKFHKSTGEWKVAATTSRKIDFVSPSTGKSTKLYDHNLDKDGRQLGRRKQQSNLFITINTNKRRFDEVVDTEAMRRALSHCFEKEVTNVLRFGPAHQLTYGGDWEYADAVIDHVEMRASVERGPST